MKVKHLISSLIILLVSTSPVLAKKSISQITVLPVTGVSMVETSDGKMVLMSSNGRFVFDGVFDTWNDKNIETTSDVKKFAQRINIDHIKLQLDDLHHYKYGSGDKRVTVFIDPKCGYCKRMIDSMANLTEEYTFNIFPVGLLGKESQKILNNLSCSTPEEGLNAIISHNYNDLKSHDKNCNPQKSMKTLATARVFGVNAVPFSISSNHITRRGGFKTNKELIDFLEQE